MSLNHEELNHVANGSLLVTPSETQPTVASISTNQRAIPPSPIHKLPSEVLASIMWTVVFNAPCCRMVNRREAKSPVLCYPDVLSHVCSHWQQVAIHSRSLWSHIDMPVWCIPGSRAMSFLSRAGQLPLNLHLIDRFNRRRDDQADPVPFLTSITPRLKSLELISRSDNLLKIHSSSLSLRLSTCVAENLTQLSIRLDDRYSPILPLFFRARSSSNEVATWTTIGPNWVDIDLPEERLEDVLRSIIVLRLDQVYAPWTSSAYRGLVELRLLGGTSAYATISELQLVNLLRSSPRLRVLHFELQIVDIASLDTTIIDPVSLHDLEVLNLHWVQTDRIEIFFRWLAPAPKLAQFSFRPFSRVDFEHLAAATFLAGSNITMIHTRLSSLKGIVSLVGPCHHIRVLAIENALLKDTREVPPFHLDTLYLITPTSNVEWLRRFVQSSSAQRLILYRFVVYHGNSVLPPDQVPTMLLDVCSNILMLPYDDPNPIEEWEVFWPL